MGSFVVVVVVVVVVVLFVYVLNSRGGHLVLKSVTMRGLKSKEKGYFLKTKARNVRSVFRVSNMAFLTKKGVYNEGKDLAEQSKS